MKMDWIVKTLLLMIAVLLGMIAFRPVVQPVTVRAETSEAYSFYIEPGVTMIRKPDGSSQVYGRMVVDMRNGDVWGFPTITNSPFPLDPTTTTPPKSHPFYIGKFLFSEAQK
jgi:hypothetical protein